MDWQRWYRAWRLVVTQVLLRRRFARVGRRTILMPVRRVVNGDRVSVGAYTFIEAGATFYAVTAYENQDHDPEIRIGDRVYSNHTLNITAARRVVIGNDVMLAFNVSIFDFNHGFRDPDTPVMRQPLAVYERGVEIADGAWIGANAFICGNVRIGKGAVVGANSVVKHDVPDHAVVTGNPARLVRLMDPASKQWNKVE